MTTRLKFLLALTLLTLYVAAGGFLLGFGVWSSLGPDDQAVFSRIVEGQAAFLVVGGLLFAGGLGFGAARFVAAYIAPMRRLADDARLIAKVNPQHRLATRHPRELATLVRAVNEL